jgi:protein-S-isoprenylcysteine O-methyltransferase Ste14
MFFGVRPGCVGATPLLVILDLAERLFVALLAIPFAVAFSLAVSDHPQYAHGATSEMLQVILVLIRRPGQVAATPYAFFIAIMGMALPLFIRPAGGVALAPGALTAAIMSGGLLLNIVAKLFLNRSFGIVAANRGVKRGGPYRLVRHPMYAGYIVSEFGFLLASFTWFNLAIYGTAWLFQLLRIQEEERWLMKDELYRNFAATTRWRLVPGLY